MITRIFTISFDGQLTDGPLSVSAFLCTLFVHSSYNLFMLHFFPCCTLFIFHFFQYTLFSCWALFMLRSVHVEIFLCCTLLVLHFLHVALFPYRTFFFIFAISITFHVFPCCTLFMLYFFSCHVEMFSCCTLLVLHFLHVELFLCSTFSVSHLFNFCYFVHFSCYLCAVLFFMFCFFFMLHSFHAVFFPCGIRFMFCYFHGCLLKRGTSWSKLERARTNWNELEPTRTSWHEIELPKTRKSQASSLQWQLQLLRSIRQKLCGKLTKTQARRASKDMEFQVNSTSWRLAALSEFLFNKYTNWNFVGQLMLCKFKGLVNLMHFISRIIFFCFSKEISYLSVMS